MRQILRYNEAIQKALGCKTKPEPWMHIGIKTPSKRLPYAGWAIWVWDTRDVLESNTYGSEGTSLAKSCEEAIKLGSRAQDNHQLLKGSKSLNAIMEFDGNAGTNADSSTRASNTNIWQQLCAKAKCDPEKTTKLYYCMANDFNEYVGGRPGEPGFTGRTRVSPLGHYVVLTPDMGDKTLKERMRASKTDTAGYARRMAARYHGNPSCGKLGEYREIVSDKPINGGNFYRL